MNIKCPFLIIKPYPLNIFLQKEHLCKSTAGSCSMRCIPFGSVHVLLWFVWNGSRYETSQLAGAAADQTTGAAREWLLAGYSISGYYTIYFCLPNPQQNKIIIHVMHCIPKELRFWNKTWIIPTFGKRGKMALLKHHINGICSKTVQNDNDIVYHVPTHFDFHKQIICMIWLLIESLNHWIIKKISANIQMYTGRIERTDKRKQL